MAITTISRMQQRRGLKDDLPLNLSEGEFGWCLDTRELFIGNGVGFGGNTPILTQFTPNHRLINNTVGTYAGFLSGAVARTLGDKLNDAASVKDWNAKGTNLVDDAPAINAAIVSLYHTSNVILDPTKARRMVLRVPAGVYRIATPLLMYPFLALIGEGKGRTTIIADGSASIPSMFMTADSLGSTGANIGIGASLIPQKIVISGMTIDTSGRKINIASLDRYQGVRFEDVEMIGGWSPGDGLNNPTVAVKLSSLGTAIDTVGAQFINCDFKNVTYGIQSDDLVYHTTVVQSRFFQVYRGISLGETAQDGGPFNMVVTHNRFVSVDDLAIYNNAENPGITSMANYIDGGMTWDAASVHNSSLCDIFPTGSNISDLGTDNIIIGPGKLSLPQLSPPSMTTTKRDNTVTAVNGMIIYNTTVNRFQGFQNNDWINLDDGTAA